MRISPISTNYYINKTPSFRSEKPHNFLQLPPPPPQQRPLIFSVNPKIIPRSLEEIEEGQMLDYNGAIFNKHLTTFCRNDLNWSDFGKYLKEKFKSPKDVDFHIFGCSSGDEPYSLALLLAKTYGTTDFEIDASDIADYMIEQNSREQKRGVVIDPFDFSKISKELDFSKDEEKFFKAGNFAYPIIKPEISNTVKFRRANVLNEVEKLDSTKPSVIFCRNMWPYVDSRRYKDFAKKLYEKLPEGSLVVIGDFDHIGDYEYIGSDTFPKALEDAGFKPTKRGESRLRKIDNRGFLSVYEK